MKLFVYHTPEQIPLDRVPDCAVVIDVLRATTTITTALNMGAEAVQVFSDLDTLMAAGQALPVEKRLLAGERGGEKVSGCELGNSPLEHTPETTGGRRLLLTTTNGTRCVKSVQKSAQVIVAALNNRHAVVRYLLKQRPDEIWLVGSGWKGSYSLEDTVCAGAIAESLQAQLNIPLGVWAGNDELYAAIALYQQWRQKLPELMVVASHGQRLLRLQRQIDLDYCAQLDSIDILPIQQQEGIFVSWEPR